MNSVIVQDFVEYTENVAAVVLFGIVNEPHNVPVLLFVFAIDVIDDIESKCSFTDGRSGGKNN